MPATIISRDEGTLSFATAMPQSLDEFRVWMESGEVPEEGRFTFVNGEFIADMSGENIESHGKLKHEIDLAIGTIIKREDLGIYYPDGTQFTNLLGGVSNQADACFASWDTLEAGRFHAGLRDDGNERPAEMEGTPDWVCEVLSDSSVRKDMKLLPDAYFRAGIVEFWRLDYRKDRRRFDLLVAGVGGWEVQKPDAEGWRRSRVFDRAFRMDVGEDRLGRRRYELQVKLATPA